VSAAEIDLIIIATATPDYVFPSTACIMQAKLGAKGCAAFDIQAVCSGFVYALAIADKLIRSGQHRCALVVGSEVFSRILDWNDRGTAVLFGDGAGAVILKADSRPGILGSVLHADGSYADILSVPGNVCGGKIVGSPFLQMDGQAVFKFAVKVLDEVARETLAQCGLTVADVDWLIPHQANIRILEATAKKIGLDRSKLVVTVDTHANTSAASVPLALDLAIRDGRIKPGHKVMLQGVGGGFTWGASLVEM
jgi:3-oxoacyl-[acyl-carrier-protein] synthase-3